MNNGSIIAHETRPWHRWYGLAVWQRRRKAQLAREPLCRRCAQAGRTVAARVADHVIPHRGDWQLFINGELQSLCDTCHSSAKQIEEVRGYRLDIGADGWPIDPRHPANQED